MYLGSLDRQTNSSEPSDKTRRSVSIGKVTKSMKTMKWVLVLMAAAMAVSAMSQTDRALWDLNKSYRGDGEEKVDGKRNREFSSASVSLRRDGVATIRLIGRQTTDFSGKWKDPVNNVVRVDVQEKDADGYIRVFIEKTDRGFEVRRIEGTVLRKDQRINLLFKCEIVGGSRTPDFGDDRDRDRGPRDQREREFEDMFGKKGSTAKLDSGGDGSLRRGRSSWDIDRVNVEIQKDGDIIIRTKGDKNETLRGKWRRDFAGRISFSLTEGFGDRKAKGTGWLSFSDKEEVDALRFTIRAKDEDYSLSFNRK